MKRLFAALLLLVCGAFGQTRSRLEYALLLEDPPVAQKIQPRMALQSSEAEAYREEIRIAQSGVVAELARRKVPVIATSQILVNTIFVSTTREVASQLGNIPGVAHVISLPPLKLDLDKALNLTNVPAAWTALGGPQNAGAGIKIGIIDSGIDQNHAGFQDSALSPPSGFPKGDANYTNNKVIVARSYVPLLNTDSATGQYYQAAYSTPDDYSPRDHMGHGTAIAMIAAGVQNTGPVATIQGVAPKAFLGNYKVFGSPGINDYPSYAVVTQALTDAFTDGMDIVTLSLGSTEGETAVYGPLDVDATNCGGACDIYAQAVENASANGMVVVASAGNDGNLSALHPTTLGLIHTPGTAPSAITVGAVANAHLLFESVHLNGPGVPAGLQSIRALFGDGPHVTAPVTGPLVDVTQLHDNGLACAALPAASLAGAIALVQRGTCAFSDKIINAQNAGAIGVVIYQLSGVDSVYSGLGVLNTGVPAVMIGNTDGTSLKSFLASTSGTTATLDPAVTPYSVTPSAMWPSSSRGPSIGSFAATQTFAIKPDLVAPGADLYTAAQKLDPNGDAYNSTGYTGVTGTSYAVPMVAGAVALVKQRYGAWRPAQLKSAVVNTATQDVVDIDGTQARVNAAGAGKLSAGDALNVAATIEPCTLSFGAVASTTVSVSLTLKVTNVTSTSATFAFTVQQRDADTKARVQVTPATLALPPGQANNVSVTLTGSRPLAGLYEGFIVVTGAGPALRVPYLYMSGDGVPYDVVTLRNGSFFTGVNTQVNFLALRLVDRYGVPVANSPVRFTVPAGASINLADAQTDRLGIAAAIVTTGAQAGEQDFTATAGGLALTFFGGARAFPAISSGGVVNAASYQAGQGMAAGSYISIFGTALADATQTSPTLSLPVSLSSVSVSFDGGGLSLPGRLYFVAPGQIDVQIPWEFQGQSSVAMKINYDASTGWLQSPVYTVPLATYSPAFFEYNDNGTLEAAVVDANTASIVSQSKPARIGDTLEFFVNGLGPVSNRPASGEPSPAPPSLANTNATPTVTIGGVGAKVTFSGLAPGIVGLYQVNAEVPASAPTGGLQTLVVSINGLSSKASKLAVQ